MLLLLCQRPEVHYTRKTLLQETLIPVSVLVTAVFSIVCQWRQRISLQTLVSAVPTIEATEETASVDF